MKQVSLFQALAFGCWPLTDNVETYQRALATCTSTTEVVLQSTTIRPGHVPFTKSPAWPDSMTTSFSPGMVTAKQSGFFRVTFPAKYIRRQFERENQIPSGVAPPCHPPKGYFFLENNEYWKEENGIVTRPGPFKCLQPPRLHPSDRMPQRQNNLAPTCTLRHQLKPPRQIL